MAVTEKTIIDTASAEKEARQLLALAYLPQPVKQPDGSVLELCWRGRLHRAFVLMGQARAEGNFERATMLDKGIDKLSEMASAAYEAADEAVAKYEATARFMGDEPTKLDPTECNCAGCVDSNRNHRMGAAMGEARDALYGLLIPARDGTLPPLVTLLKSAPTDNASRDRLWLILQRLATGLQDYADAKREAGEEPNWQQIWPC